MIFHFNLNIYFSICYSTSKECHAWADIHFQWPWLNVYAVAKQTYSTKLRVNLHLDSLKWLKTNESNTLNCLISIDMYLKINNGTSGSTSVNLLYSFLFCVYIYIYMCLIMKSSLNKAKVISVLASHLKKIISLISSLSDL